jgi:hypothetical protein
MIPAIGTAKSISNHQLVRCYFLRTLKFNISTKNENAMAK